MQTIYKFPLAIVRVQTIETPVGAKVLAVQEQHGIGVIWVLCDTAAAKERRRFLCVSTGVELPDDHGSYLGTFQTHDGYTVVHVFDCGVAP